MFKSFAKSLYYSVLIISLLSPLHVWYYRICLDPDHFIEGVYAVGVQLAHVGTGCDEVSGRVLCREALEVVGSPDSSGDVDTPNDCL